jgi:hypothetical protein
MENFSTKMEQVLNIQDTFPGDVFMPGRTDKKIIRGETQEQNKEYRSHVGTLNLLYMGVRYDVVYIHDKGTLTCPKRTYSNGK